MTLSPIQVAAQKQADSIIKKSGSTISSMTDSFDSLFGYESLTAAGTAFGSGDVAVPNEGLMKALATSQDSCEFVASQLLVMERFVALTIPKMEDGNNFGVTIQLNALKHMKEEREAVTKAMEELSKYATSRADAMEKCKLPSSASSKVTAKSTSESQTKGGEKEGASSSTETKVEEKTTQTAGAEMAEMAFRKQAIVAVDTLYYSKAKMALQTALTAFMTSVDFLEKNKEKIEKPKGSGGGRANFSMY